MKKCPECHCLTSSGEKHENHMATCSKYDAKAGGDSRKAKT